MFKRVFNYLSGDGFAPTVVILVALIFFGQTYSSRKQSEAIYQILEQVQENHDMLMRDRGIPMYHYGNGKPLLPTKSGLRVR